MAKKWDRSRIYNSAALSEFFPTSLTASGAEERHLNEASSLQNWGAKEEETLLNIFFLLFA